MPILIHAGRGIPALGRDTLELAQRYPGARFILAHAAVSDLAWLWRADARAPEPLHRHLVVEPGRLRRALQPGAARPDPLGERQPLRLAAPRGGLPAALRARWSGSRGDQIRSIAGEQIERILAGEEPADLGPPPGPPGPQDPGMERVVSHLTTAIGRAMAEGDPSRVGRPGTPGGRPRRAGGRDGPGDPAPARPRRPARRARRLPAAASPAPRSS